MKNWPMRLWQCLLFFASTFLPPTNSLKSCGTGLRRLTSIHRYSSELPGTTTNHNILLAQMKTGSRNSFAHLACLSSSASETGENIPEKSITSAEQEFPYGVFDWPEIVKSNLFYIDKTKAIEDLESSGRFCKLWRPHLSGKSLFCQQLMSYYDIAVPKSQFDELFGHTYIGKNPTAERGKYYILLLDFSVVSTSGDVEKNFRDYINRKVNRFIKKYPDVGKDVTVNPNNHLSTLKSLFAALRLANQKLYVIVDEYDSFANRLLIEIADPSKGRLGKAEYEASVSEVESVLRSFGCVLKSGTAGAIKRVFFTGVTPIAFTDGFSSSLNIVQDLSTRPCFETTFGFTADEVKDALARIYPRDSAEFNRCFMEMKENFNGYRFNENQQVAVFNPQMCLYYFDEVKVLGKSPKELLDDNLAGKKVANFLKDNYRSAQARNKNLFELLLAPISGTEAEPSPKQKNPMEFVFGSFDKAVYTSFRGEDLFNIGSVDQALCSLAYYHGFLTHADPTSNQKGLLVPPNKVTRKLFLGSMVGNKPLLDQLWNVFSYTDKAAALEALTRVGLKGEEARASKETVNYLRLFIERSWDSSSFSNQ